MRSDELGLKLEWQLFFVIHQLMLQRLKRKTDSISHLRKCYKGYKHDLQLYFNAHVGTDRNGFELFLGPHAVAESANDHGQRLLDTCPSNNFVIGARGRHLREFWVGGVLWRPSNPDPV